jgi:uncharacterized protein YfbU (UPF0304 family)
MKLTQTERWILSNQLSLLAKLDPALKDHYEESRNIIDNGYEGLYNHCIKHLCPEGETISEDVSNKVFDILNMFRNITNSIRKLEDTTGLDVEELRFHGFDGNEESDYLVFAEFFCTEFEGGRYPEVVEYLDSFNTHYPILDSYNRMLEVWKTCNNKFHLTQEELLEIQEAAIHPSTK